MTHPGETMGGLPEPFTAKIDQQGDQEQHSEWAYESYNEQLHSN